MKQKLIAAAVVGAFAVPAVAFAQGSTVQIYGTLNAEYGFAKGVAQAAGGKSNNWDGLNSGASNIGFKGEEKLGGGMSAFFQCETDIGFLKGDSVNANVSNGIPAATVTGHQATQGGWCSRNSAIGLKGGFGSFYIGTWDSPMKRAVGATRMIGETGWLGVQSMLISNGGGFTGTFSDRNANSINYDSPKFGGFSASFQTTTTKEAATVTTAGLKGRATSFSLNYAAGPLAVAAAHTVKDDNRSAGNVNGTEDKAWTLGGTYAFGKAKVGLTYVDAKAERTLTETRKRKSWNIAGSYDLPGPHSVFAGYTLAGDTKSSLAVPAAGTGANTGAKGWQIGYGHALSKRTNATLAYSRVKNDSAATGYSVGTNHASTGLQAGASSSVVVMSLNHKF